MTRYSFIKNFFVRTWPMFHVLVHLHFCRLLCPVTRNMITLSTDFTILRARYIVGCTICKLSAYVSCVHILQNSADYSDCLSAFRTLSAYRQCLYVCQSQLIFYLKPYLDISVYNRTMVRASNLTVFLMAEIRFFKYS